MCTRFFFWMKMRRVVRNFGAAVLMKRRRACRARARTRTHTPAWMRRFRRLTAPVPPLQPDHMHVGGVLQLQLGGRRAEPSRAEPCRAKAWHPDSITPTVWACFPPAAATHNTTVPTLNMLHVINSHACYYGCVHVDDVTAAVFCILQLHVH